MDKVSSLREEAKVVASAGSTSHQNDALLIAADKTQVAVDNESISALKDAGMAGAGVATGIGLHKLNKFLKVREVAEQTAQSAVERAMARARGDKPSER